MSGPDITWWKYYRKSEENEFYFSERFTKWQAWIDLLNLATYKARTVFIRDVEIHLKPGELCYSLRSLAKRWKWNVKTVMKFLSLLENREMLEQRKTHITTVITIRNWCRYQGDGTPHGTRKEHGADTNKKVKKVENAFEASQREARELQRIRAQKETVCRN